MDQKRAGRLASLDVRRIQSLSDSVFAIVITILAFTLVVPAGEDDEGLKRFLWDQILPKLFIFFLGFIIVGAFWVDTHYNHHLVKYLFSDVYLFDPFLVGFFSQLSLQFN